MQGLAKFLEEGGTLMYINLVVSIITLAIIVDRAIFFLGKGSVNARAFLEQIRKLVLANNIDRAVKLCSATEAPVAQVARAGLQRVHRGEIAIAQSIEETLVDVTPLLKKRVQILWSIANMPLIGRQVLTPVGLLDQEQELPTLATVFGFWEDAARAFRADGHLQAWDAGLVVPRYGPEHVTELVDGTEPVELRCFLRLGNRTLTETWLYQYIPFTY